MGINRDKKIFFAEMTLFDGEYVQYFKPVLVICRAYLWITAAGFAVGSIAFAVNRYFLSSLIFAPLSGMALFGACKVRSIEHYFENPIRWVCTHVDCEESVSQGQKKN